MNETVLPDLVVHLHFLLLVKEIPTLMAMRTKELGSKCCPPAFAGMTMLRIFYIYRRKN